MNKLTYIIDFFKQPHFEFGLNSLKVASSLPSEEYLIGKKIDCKMISKKIVSYRL